jgi:hypothetical protein
MHAIHADRRLQVPAAFDAQFSDEGTPSVSASTDIVSMVWPARTSKEGQMKVLKYTTKVKALQTPSMIRLFARLA